MSCARTCSALLPAVCCGVRHRLLTRLMVMGLGRVGSATSTDKRWKDGAMMLSKSNAASSASSVVASGSRDDMRRVVICHALALVKCYRHAGWSMLTAVGNAHLSQQLAAVSGDMR